MVLKRARVRVEGGLRMAACKQPVRDIPEPERRCAQQVWFRGRQARRDSGSLLIRGDAIEQREPIGELRWSRQMRGPSR